MENQSKDIVSFVYDNLEKVSKDRVIITPNSNGFYILHEPKDIVDVNFMDFAEKMYFEIAYPKMMLFFSHNPMTKNFPIDFVDDFVRKQITKDFHSWDSKQILQPFLLQLLTSDINKKAQINLLKGKYITSEQIHAFFREASKLGYLYSHFFFTKIPKGYEKTKLPSFAYVHKDGIVEKYGTKITDNAVKNLVETQQRTFVRFATREKEWHCIISDLSGITGREIGKEFGGIAHMHYISNKFGITKEALMESLQICKHPSTAYHIRLKGYKE